ncbi:CbrC family protein [Deinococcus phoenicis]|uniref:CbrC family protein n=1 Tax=Deinococcus phoenicis TaxID=1476583 RepID=UPI0009DD3009|nr:CbrC family protein [Deinococcus phoenicis]
MSAQGLLDFPYYADPLADGCFKQEAITCEVCEQRREWAYTGGLYAANEPDSLCPWCVADGSAAARFEGTFQDVYFSETASTESRSAVLERTPRVVLWNPVHWPDHCGECCTYLGTLDPSAQPQLAAQESIQWEARDLARSISATWTAEDLLDCAVRGTMTLHLFRCRNCETYSLSLDGT